MNARQELKREAETIMLAGGFTEARAEHFGPWWRVYGKLAGDNEHVGTTHLQADPQDPREMARTLVLRAKAEPEEIPEAAETVEETFPQGEGPFDPQPEPEQNPQDETHGETGEEASDEDPSSVGAGRDQLADTDDVSLRLPAGLGYVDAGAAEDVAEPSGEYSGDDRGEADLIDADFEPIPDLPEIELIPPEDDPDFFTDALDAEIEGELAIPAPRDDWEEEHAQQEASGAFIFGDNLHQMRTAAIGLVMQAAIHRLPPATDYALFSELRNFTMGVSEGRWPDDPAKRAQLDSMEAVEALRRRIEAIRDERVAYLMEATREQIEAFDPESDWP